MHAAGGQAPSATLYLQFFFAVEFSVGRAPGSDVDVLFDRIENSICMMHRPTAEDYKSINRR